ncbi:hypothetical protein ABB37_06068 [Leptomonas pyrrhocoris]|uniref:Transmembrane protein n=1 Tax=Leptomonas pyrrhocoris TaxID=157538 RepID=A0A0N0DU57_LEPPY|nr:hypothetical protein ABB37_06068 [Leptomonas pyrrhocoris]KPA78441.1 hypothetical protein ABB37_06068 [Leptomonas pyrrhocoris]|eukprot:XP_015656880.1 hypothetical protein ABB37_06068 [Leptomonas pyrrhocoris]
MSASATTTPATGERYSFFRSYQYIWTRQRPERTSDELTALRRREETAEHGDADVMTFEDRVAIRSLFYAVVDDANLRNILDGTLLPPPYSLRDLRDKRWTEKDVKAICGVLNPSLDLLVVNLPFNLALRLGAYDARLRAAARRLSWILAVPFSLVELKENALAQLRTSVGANAGSDLAADTAKQEQVRRSKEERKRSLSRIATIGGFAVLGGAALVVTGGLAAPLVGSAYAALVAATATTLGAIGAVGGAVLGTGALAAAFAAVVGVATHAAALAAVVTPALTAANLTAIFGITGASLSGYKAFRRTTESDVFMLRSVDEVEAFQSGAGSAGGGDDGASGGGDDGCEDRSDDMVKRLASSNQAVQSGGSVGSSWDLSAVVEDNSRPGVVVPAHTRVVAMAHANNISSIRRRRRHVVFAVQNNLEGFELRLKAIKVLSGLWAMTPPAQIAPGQAGVFACVNRFAHPTGAGFIVCYIAIPVRTAKAAAALRIWVRAERDFLGAWALSAACETAEQDFDPSAAEYWMDEHLSSTGVTRRQQGVALEVHVTPFTYLKLYPATAAAKAQGRLITFPAIELPQRQIEYGHDVKQRRKLGVSVVNRSIHTVQVRDFAMVNGEQWSQTASPMTVHPAEASLTYFTNSGWSLEGAEGYYILEVVNNYREPVTPKYYVRVQFEVSSLNNINVAFASAYNIGEIKTQPMKPAAPSSLQFNVELPAGLFLTAICIIDPSQYTLQVIVQDFVERPSGASLLESEKTTLSIGISGYSAVFDPRRPVRDQQVGLWQPVLRRSELLGPTEAYCLHWEDEYLMRFGESIHVNLHVADTVTKKAIGKVKKTVKKALTQGALFTGMHAFASFMGAFELPLYAVWATDIIDNNFATLSNRSTYAGKDLAAVLLDPQRGNRPVTLVGFSFGARVIVECLRELEKVRAYHIVENAYLLGSTCSSDPELWWLLRRVVAGRLINVYTRQDWMLWTMYRLNKTDLKPMAGINPVNVPGVENIDVTPLISGHGDYAANLLPVLAAIPAEPTPATWSPQQHSGSPGVTVALKSCDSTVAAVRNSLHSYLTSTPYMAVGLKNCLLTDIALYEPQIELLSVQLYGCFFDFMPPPLTKAGMASVAGLLGESETDMGAVVAFRVKLPPAAPRDLLVLLLLSSTPDGDVQMCVQPNLVERRAASTEPPTEAYGRLCTIAAETCRDLEDVRRMCRLHGVDWESQGSTPYRLMVPVALPDTATDKHRTGSVRLELTRTDVGAATLTFLGLFTAGSTQLQQEQFDERQFKSGFAALQSARQNGSDGGLGGWNGLQMPVVADTHSTDHMQSQLRSIAAKLQDPDKRPSTSTTPFVLVNCGTTPLYFCESFYDDNVSIDGDSQDAPSYDALRAPRWSRFPPPEIPPNGFAVPLLVKGDAAMDAIGDVRQTLPTIRYETNRGECGFDIDFSSTTPTSEATTTEAAAATVRDSGGDARCTVVSGRPAVGEVSVFHSDIGGVGFVMVMMTPRSISETDSGDDGAEGATVQSRLRDRGWYVV